MADTTIDTQVKSGPSLVVQIGVLVVLTLVTGGAGWLSGGYLGLGGNLYFKPDTWGFGVSLNLKGPDGAMAF